MTDSIGAIGSFKPFKEGTIRIPLKGEEIVVRKEAVVTGEVVVTKERTIEREEITETVRRQDVVLDEDEGGNEIRGQDRREGPLERRAA
jgi:uncharacterized protein (TIGR02271 family)